MLNPDLDLKALAEAYQPRHRAHIPDFLTEAARAAVLTDIEGDIPWQVSLDSQGKGLNIERGAYLGLDAGQRRTLDELVHAQAARGFQYLFESYRLSDEVEAGRCPFPALKGLYDFLNGADFLGFIRDLTGETRGVYCDAQVTRFGPGHFLTTHTDLEERKGRLFAYVINLSPVWRSDWGGLLQFIGPGGHIEQAFTPQGNALNLFRVPQPHAVSCVAPFAMGRRTSITGWIRQWPDPKG